jgi:serine/threonine protein kinase
VKSQLVGDHRLELGRQVGRQQAAQHVAGRRCEQIGVLVPRGPRRWLALGHGRRPTWGGCHGRQATDQISRGLGFDDRRVAKAVTGSGVETDDPLRGTRYRGLRLLGRGGMGEVWEAEHLELGRLVVVKLLRTEVADAQHAERFRIEAQIVARLRHPHIVEILDRGATPEGRPYLVLERLRGRTLTAELNARGVVPLAEAVAWTVAILRALDHAHAAGVVHRDVKLDNVFLHDAGRGPTIKLLDFGIAKLTESTLGITPSAHPTREGWILGTPRYLAPEQILGRPVDARTDVYATGVLLFTLLTRRRPFEHRESDELLRAQVTEPAPRASSVAPRPIPARLDEAVNRALAKRRADRFPSAAAFADELEAVRAALVAGATVVQERPPTITTEAATNVMKPSSRPEPPAAPGPAVGALPVEAPRDARPAASPSSPGSPLGSRERLPSWLVVLLAAGSVFLLLTLALAALAGAWR